MPTPIDVSARAGHTNREFGMTMDLAIGYATGASVLYAPAWQLGLQTLALAALISLLASGVAVAQAGGFQPRAAFSTE